MITISKKHIANLAMLAAAAMLLFAVPTQSMGAGPSTRPSTSADAASPGDPVQFQVKRGKLPRGARYLTGQELFELYVGKTWKWGEGGGYFGPHGVFRARTYGEKGTTNAGGTWAVNDKGRICFRAVWTNSGGSSKANTCFDHVLFGGDVYQRRLPKGVWYVFRHGVPNERDQYNKLVEGNLVAVSRAD